MDAVSKRMSGIYGKDQSKYCTHGSNMGPDSYLGQGAITVTENFPKSIGVWCTRHIHGHSNNSDRFRDGRHGFRDGNITKANIQTSGGDLPLKTVGQAIPRSHVEQLYGYLKAFQPLESRRSDFVPIGDLCEDHIYDFFNKWDTGSGGGPGESGDDRYFESGPSRKFDASITNVAKHLISCPTMDGFGVVEGMGVGGKH